MSVSRQIWSPVFVLFLVLFIHSAFSGASQIFNDGLKCKPSEQLCEYGYPFEHKQYWEQFGSTPYTGDWTSVAEGHTRKQYITRCTSFKFNIITYVSFKANYISSDNFIVIVVRYATSILRPVTNIEARIKMKSIGTIMSVRNSIRTLTKLTAIW